MGRRSTPLLVAALMAALSGGNAPARGGFGPQRKRSKPTPFGGHTPHVGKREVERRRRQIERGILKVSVW